MAMTIYSYVTESHLSMYYMTLEETIEAICRNLYNLEGAIYDYVAIYAITIESGKDSIKRHIVGFDGQEWCNPDKEVEEIRTWAKNYEKSLSKSL